MYAYDTIRYDTIEKFNVGIIGRDRPCRCYVHATRSCVQHWMNVHDRLAYTITFLDSTKQQAVNTAFQLI